MDIILKQNPEIVHMAPVCSPWSQLSNSKPEWQRIEDRKRAMPMVRICVQVALHQIKKGRKFIRENPEGSAIWKCYCMEDLFKVPGVTWGVLHQCAFGMKDPVDKLPYKMATCLVHNLAED